MPSSEQTIRCTCEARQGQAEKLKDSCDGCARAKTKCNRDQNGCQRCKRRGEMCHYSRARRIGKHRATCATSLAAKARREAALHQQGQQGHHRSMSNSSDLSSSTFMHAGADYSPPPFMRERSMNIKSPLGMAKDPSFDLFDTGLDMNLDNFHLDSQFGSYDTFDPQMLSEPPPALTTSSSESTIPSISTMSPDYSYAAMDPVASLNNYPIQSSSNSSTSSGHSQPQECTRMACLTLHSLHIPASSCKYTEFSEHSDQSHSSPQLALQSHSIGQFLENSKTAMQNLQQILSCPCSWDPNLALLCALIMIKIVDTYKIARPHSSSHSSSSNHIPTSSANTTATSINTNGYKFLDLPICIGNFELDHTSRTKVFAQLVLGELMKLRNLIEMTLKRYASLDQHRDGITGRMAGSNNMQFNLSSAMMRNVHEKIRMAILEINSEKDMEGL